MPQSPTTAHRTDGWSEFDKTTSRYGRLTMLAALALTIIGPGYIAVFTDLDIQLNHLTVATLALAGTFGVIWIIEPVAFYPILGPASMYQAFMIGNISNKLLPAAIVAQDSIAAKPGTKRGQLASVLAICGATAVHLLSLFLLVGIVGTLLVEILPEPILATVQTFIFPAIIGSVFVQLVMSNPQLKIASVAAAVCLLIVLVLVPLFPALAFWGTAIAVMATIVLSILLARKRGRRGRP